MDKFVINKGMSNEFILTIKQNDSTLPMVIATTGLVFNTEVSSVAPTYTTTPEVEEVEYQAEVLYQAAVEGQVYIPSYPGVKEKYRLNVLTNNIDVDYTVTVEGTSYTVNVPTAYASKTELLVAIAALIDTRADVNAYVDANYLYIEAVDVGVSFSIYTTDNMTIVEEAAAEAAIAGQEYIAAVEEVPYSAEVTAVSYSPEMYTSTADQTFVIDTPKLRVDTGYTNVVTITSGDVASIEVNDVAVTPNADGKYDIGTADSFTIIPTAVTNATTKPAIIYYEVETTSITVLDTFAFNLIDLESNTITLTGTSALESGSRIEIFDPANGQIKLIFTSEDVETLKIDRGSKADRYYNKPVYRLAIDCVTANNGNFVAKIPEVYVEV